MRTEPDLCGRAVCCFCLYYTVAVKWFGEKWRHCIRSRLVSTAIDSRGWGNLAWELVEAGLKGHLDSIALGIRGGCFEVCWKKGSGGCGGADSVGILRCAQDDHVLGGREILWFGRMQVFAGLH